jgi:hypothetical protein
VAGYSPRIPGFDLKLLYEKFVFDNLALGEIFFSEYFLFSPVQIIPPMFHINLHPHFGLVCLFPWASAASYGCTAACWLIVPPALDVPTLTTSCPRAYRRVPQPSGGSWNLWAWNRTGNFA